MHPSGCWGKFGANQRGNQKGNLKLEDLIVFLQLCEFWKMVVLNSASQSTPLAWSHFSGLAVIWQVPGGLACRSEAYMFHRAPLWEQGSRSLHAHRHSSLPAMLAALCALETSEIPSWLAPVCPLLCACFRSQQPSFPLSGGVTYVHMNSSRGGAQPSWFCNN